MSTPRWSQTTSRVPRNLLIHACFGYSQLARGPWVECHRTPPTPASDPTVLLGHLLCKALRKPPAHTYLGSSYPARVPLVQGTPRPLACTHFSFMCPSRGPLHKKPHVSLGSAHFSSSHSSRVDPIQKALGLPAHDRCSFNQLAKISRHI